MEKLKKITQDHLCIKGHDAGDILELRNKIDAAINFGRSIRYSDDTRGHPGRSYLIESVRVDPKLGIILVANTNLDFWQLVR